jgi:hypothetical protein
LDETVSKILLVQEKSRLQMHSMVMDPQTDSNILIDNQSMTVTKTKKRVESPVQKYVGQSGLDRRSLFKLKEII